MNRRDFVSRVTLGAAYTAVPSSPQASAVSGEPADALRRHDGVHRARRPLFLVATPAAETAHVTHVLFLMAKAGVADCERPRYGASEGRRLPRAFDTELEKAPTRPNTFYRNPRQHVDRAGRGQRQCGNRERRARNGATAEDRAGQAPSQHM